MSIKGKPEKRLENDVAASAQSQVKLYVPLLLRRHLQV